MRKIMMAAVVVVMVLAILITPQFIGVPELSSLPQLILDHVNNQTKIYVKPSFGHHRYSVITINVKDIEDLNRSWNYTITENNTYLMHCTIDDSNTRHFMLNITVVDEIGEDGSCEFYDYNCTIEVSDEPLFDILKEGKEEPIEIMGEENLPYIAILERRT